jgi:two-component system chemotaxis sensor kinase CheA
MAIDLDDEILQDFLVEAGEILELLGEQLVELEQSPEDQDLLNAIFRGFHTVKGGAGFLAIDALVGVCHKAEDVFNVLRQGDRKVTPDLMDVVLQVLDIVNEMFDNIRSGVDPEPAEAELLETLQTYTQPDNGESVQTESSDETVSEPEAAEDHAQLIENAAEAVEQEFAAMLGAGEADGTEQESASESSPEPETSTDQNAATSDEITEQEFEELLDALHGPGGSPTTSEEPAVELPSDEITEQEFDALLDELHGKGGAPTVKTTENSSEQPVQQSSSSSEITEEEFDNLMDDLHGKGKFVGVPGAVKDEQKPNPEPADKPAVETEKSTAKPKLESKPENVVPITKKKEKPAKNATTPQGESTVRVDTQVLDEIMNMVGELVLVRNRFQTLRSVADDEQISKAVSNLDVVTADLQLSVMKTRMQPIKKVFGRFPRVVRDLARSLNKEIKLELVGEETDLDKNLVEALADPLVHLVRNAVDHGIEAPDVREAAGKPREGTVVLTASQEGDHIQLTIEDNGKGMNPDVLRQKAVEKGIMDEESAARLDDKDCYNLIFAPGFSTKSEISDVSGRGVGMDVVKTRITQMNGTVEIDSKDGKGSTIIIKVPLTLAIMPTLMVKLGGQAFALPLASVMEILDLDLTKSNVVDGQQVVMVRERALPLFYLGDWLVNDPGYCSKSSGTGHVVVVNAGGRQIGFVVDQLIGQEEVVIKPLGAKLHGLDGLSGATITGDGQIALILDVPGMMRKYAA